MDVKWMMSFSHGFHLNLQVFLKKNLLPVTSLFPFHKRRSKQVNET